MKPQKKTGLILVGIGTFLTFAFRSTLGIIGGLMLGGVFLAVGFTLLFLEHYEKKEADQATKTNEANITFHLRCIIEKAIDEYEKNNNSKVNHNSVYDLYFRLCDNEIKNLKNVEEVHNLTFGIIGVTTICCMIIDNDGYQSVRNNPNLLNKISGLFVHEVSDDKLKDFRNIMDTFCFVMLSEQVDKISEDDTTDNRDFSLNIEALICVSVKNFSIKHNLPLSEEATEYIDEILNQYM
jgi:hypothetical protein